MSVLPESFERYRKFVLFVLKYWNSDIVKSASDLSLHDLKDEEEEKEVYYNKPQELVEDLKNMGPTYVKLGQLLSTRPDLLPDAYLEALASLQDDVDEISFDEVKQLIEDELGVKLFKAFKSFEETPMASASIGQVHKAYLPSGKAVAVKIQRPGTRKKFVDDLDTIQEMTAMAVKHSKMARKYALDDVIEELRHILLNELDYVREAQNLTLLGENLQHFTHIIIPQPVNDYSGSRVITMDFVEGKKITKITGIERTDNDYTVLMDELVEAYLQQIIVDGFAHADPHPGNVHITRDSKIALMDLGMTAKFSPDMQNSLMRLLIAISQRNGDEITEILLYISNYTKEADLNSFRRNINRIVMDSQDVTAKGMEMGRLLLHMNRIAADNAIKIPVELNILGKILLNLDQIVASLTPAYDFQKALKACVEKIMNEKMLKDLKPENMFSLLLESKKLTESLPKRLNTITEKLANNEFEIKVQAIDEKRFTDGFQKVANRITLGLIIAAMIIGAAMMIRVPTRFTLLGYPALAIIIFIVAIIAALLLAYKIVFKDEDLKEK